jgi:large subunit ribosomal protein L31
VKPGIHPEYNAIEVKCACGNTWTTRSTAKSIHVEICAKCHPYFTGKLRLVDTAGRIERFRAKYRSPEEIKAEAKIAADARAAEDAQDEREAAAKRAPAAEPANS